MPHFVCVCLLFVRGIILLDVLCFYSKLYADTDIPVYFSVEEDADQQDGIIKAQISTNHNEINEALSLKLYFYRDSLKGKIVQVEEEAILGQQDANTEIHIFSGNYNEDAQKLTLFHSSRGRLRDRCEFCLICSDKKTDTVIDFLAPHIRKEIKTHQLSESDQVLETACCAFEDVCFSSAEREGRPSITIIPVKLPALSDNSSEYESDRDSIETFCDVYNRFCSIVSDYKESFENSQSFLLKLPSLYQLQEKRINSANPVFVNLSSFMKESLRNMSFAEGLTVKVYVEQKKLFLAIFHAHIDEEVAFIGLTSSLGSDNDILPIAYFNGSKQRKAIQNEPHQISIPCSSKSDKYYKDVTISFTLSANKTDAVCCKDGYKVSMNDSATCFSFSCSHFTRSGNFEVVKFINPLTSDRLLYFFLSSNKEGSDDNGYLNVAFDSEVTEEIKKTIAEGVKKYLKIEVEANREGKAVCITASHPLGRMHIRRTAYNPMVFRIPGEKHSNSVLYLRYELSFVEFWRYKEPPMLQYNGSMERPISEMEMVMKKGCGILDYKPIIGFMYRGTYLRLTFTGKHDNDWDISVRSDGMNATESSFNCFIQSDFCKKGKIFGKCRTIRNGKTYDIPLTDGLYAYLIIKRTESVTENVEVFDSSANTTDELSHGIVDYGRESELSEEENDEVRTGLTSKKKRSRFGSLPSRFSKSWRRRANKEYPQQDKHLSDFSDLNDLNEAWGGR
jgi:hypothetical protein